MSIEPRAPNPEARLTHVEFVAAYGRGEVEVEMDPPRAAHFLSARLLLPLVMMPVLGIGIAAALAGWIYTGLAVIAAGIVVPRLIKRNAPRFLLQNALSDERLYEDLVRAGVLRVTPVGAEGRGDR